MSSPKQYAAETRNRDKLLDKKSSKSFEDKVHSTAHSLFSQTVRDQELFFLPKLEDYEYTMKAAKMELSADMYLSKSILYSIAALVVGLVLGVFISILGILSGTFGSMFGAPVIVYTVSSLITILLGVLPCILTGVAMYMYPKFRASQRKTAINNTLPEAVTFMYALNRGGMSLIEVLKTLSEAENTYGEVSNEVGVIVSDIELQATDLNTALEKAGNRTPSEKFSDLIDDLLGVLKSGGNVNEFLDSKADEMIEDARREQKAFLGQLELLGEVYVTGFVAGPLFLIIITVVMAIVGGGGSGTIMRLQAIVYGLLPMMNIGYFFLIDFISGADNKSIGEISKDNLQTQSDVTIEKYVEQNENETVKKIYDEKMKRERNELINNPKKALIDNPNKILLFSSIIAVLQVIGFGLMGYYELSLSAFIDSYLEQTVLAILIPIYITVIPLIVTFEISARRESAILGRLPDFVSTLESNNSVGMTLTEAIDVVSETETGKLGEELRQVRNDIKWNHDVNNALIRFANRVKVATLSRTVKLITEANESTGDIGEVLAIAAKTINVRQRLEEERNQEMLMYTMVILVSFGVYLFVIFLIEQNFLTKIADLGGEKGGSDTPDLGGSSNSDGGGIGSSSSLPVQKVRMIFYHSTIIQAFGSGMLAGYLKTSDVRSGLKFGVLLSFVATLIFAFL
jgi:flagellar protein FlaJ